MWFIKDHLGNESGPHEFKDLLVALAKSPLKENATLVRNSRQESWKPAMLVFPEAYDESGPSDEPLLTLPTNGKPDSTLHPERIARKLNQLRVVLPICTVLISLLVSVVIHQPNAVTVNGNETVLTRSNSNFVCLIFFIPALTTLLRMVAQKPQPAIKSIHYCLILSHRFFISLCIAAGLSIALQLSVTFMT